MSFELWDYLEECLNHEAELAEDIDVQELDSIPDPKDVRLEVGKWYEVNDIVCLYADMVDSTKLLGRLDEENSAQIHQLFTGGLTSVFEEFGRDYADIKGDGGFALWKYDFGSALAVVAAATFKSYVEDYLRSYVKEEIDEDTEIQCRLGIAKGRVLDGFNGRYVYGKIEMKF